MKKPYTLNQPVYKDHRGSFTPINITGEWVQSNLSINDDIFTFRGLHFQESSKSQNKLVSVIQGKIIDFVVKTELALNIQCLLKGYINIISGKSVAFHYESKTREVDSVEEEIRFQYNTILLPFIQKNVDKLKKYFYIKQ